uniref:SbcC-like subunit of palindrome specific endonuclease n=1 Tax=Ochrobactrum phage ORM_20 TaxID=2985243 RepID=A0A9N6ZG96_9VIRU|nr:SbcC-like subunit of palindrome specific endonuclease [Ochrobactrum phage ORM_20]
MRFEFIKVVIKNFLSFGNTPTELILNEDAITSVSAANGLGKTALAIDSIFFGLFGKTYRDLTKDQIVNSINMKDCLVDLHLTQGGKSIEIKRGISPDIFNVFIDGQSMWDDLRVIDRQKALEKYLGIDRRTVENQILISEKSEPFMAMDGPTRKAFVEKMLNIEIFDDIHRLVKEEVKRLKPKVSEMEIKVRSKKEMLDRLIAVRSEQSDGYDPKEAETLKERIEKGSEVTKVLRTKAEEARDAYNLVKGEFDVLEREYSKCEGKLESLRRALDKANEPNATCSVCGQTLPDGDNGHLVEELEAAERELKSFAIETAREKMETLRADASGCIEKYKIADERLTGLKDELASLEKKKPSETIDDQILEVTGEYDEIMSEKEKLDEEYADALELDKVLKSGVAKAPLISEYIPFFNLKVNEHLEALGLPILLELDPSFKENIRSRFRQNFTYSSFSTGQQARINFAILLTWREISEKISSVSSNLLIIDEFGSKLDEAGIVAIPKLLSALTETNTICITPKTPIGEYDRKLKIKTVSNFSIVEEEKA